MENLFKKILEKKRSERSSSGESSTSPDAKKTKSGDVNFPEGVEEHEAEDKIFTALNMAEGLHKTLEEKSKAGKARCYPNNSQRCPSVPQENGGKNT